MDQVTSIAEQAIVCHAARMFYRLYGDIFRSLPRTPEDAPWN